jgi:hypothetical protein
MRTKDGWLPAINVSTNGPIDVTLESVPIEPLESEGGGPGWGSSLLVRPNKSTVYWSRAYGQTPKPWSELDLRDLTIRTTSTRADGLHGDLRDAVLDADGRHAWMLLTHGFAKVDLDLMREVEVLRDGLPTYLWRLFEFGEELVGATGWSGGTVTVIDRRSMKIIRTIRTPSPDVVLAGPDGDTVELLAFNAELRRTLRISTMSLGNRNRIPSGTGPLLVGRRIWFVEGDRDPDSPARIRRIRGRNVSVLDVDSNAIVARSPALDQPVRVIAVDGGGRPLVQCRFGLDLLDPVDLRPIAQVRQDLNQFGPIAALPDGSSALGSVLDINPDRFVVIRWRPTKRQA